MKKEADSYIIEQISGYQWGKGRGEVQYGSWRGVGGRVIMGLYEILCVKLLKIVRYCRI